MKLTIIPIDKVVYQNSVSFHDMSLLSAPADVRALQWNNDAGWIEYFDGRPNEDINELPAWALDSLSEWEEANKIAEQAQAAAIPTQELTDEQKLSMIRIERNNRLAASDWSMAEDAPVDKEAWKAYRQALRDLPANITNINDVVYPIQPISDTEPIQLPIPESVG